MTKQLWIASGAVALWCFGFAALPAHAASMYIEQRPTAFGVGDVVEMIVAFDQENDHVNAIQGTLTYDPTFLQYIGTNTARSAVNLWVENPQTATEVYGALMFSGVTPGGFGDVVLPPDDGYPSTVVFVARFRAVHSGTTHLDIADAQSFANDGDGTVVQTAAPSYTVTILDAPQHPDADTAFESDHTSPGMFTITIAHDANAFEGQRFATFTTTDKESGVAYYEVRENGGEALRAESPYVLRHQHGFVALQVTAFDAAGNKTDAYTLVWPSLWSVGVGCIILFMITIVLVVRKWRLWTRRRSENH